LKSGVIWLVILLDLFTLSFWWPVLIEVFFTQTIEIWGKIAIVYICTDLFIKIIILLASINWSFSTLTIEIWSRIAIVTISTDLIIKIIIPRLWKFFNVLITIWILSCVWFLSIITIHTVLTITMQTVLTITLHTI